MASQSVADRLGLDKGQHDLKIGRSFDKISRETFHTIRYDFKPASVDTNQESSLLIGGDAGVEMTVPHIQTSGTTHTVYKGNKRPLQKECVLIINHDTGDIALERLSCNIQLKKTRSDPSSRVIVNPRPLTPIDKMRGSPSGKAAMKPMPGAPSTHTSTQKAMQPSQSNAVKIESSLDDMEMSSSSSSGSSSGSSDSDSDDENTIQHNKPGNAVESTRLPTSSELASYHTTLSQDLQLTDSSDEDSD